MGFFLSRLLVIECVRRTHFRVTMTDTGLPLDKDCPHNDVTSALDESRVSAESGKRQQGQKDDAFAIVSNSYEVR